VRKAFRVSFKGVDYYKIDDLPSDDEKMIRSLTREFLEEEVETFIVNAWDWEEPLNMRELAPRMGGLACLELPCNSIHSFR